MRIRRFLAITGTTGAMVLAAAGCNSAVKGWASPDVNVGSNSGSASSQSASAKSSGGSNSSTNKGGSSTSSKSGGGAAASSTNSGGGAATSTPDAGSSGASIPANFPMPPGADVNKYGGTALIQVTDPQAAYTFWLSELPKAGYTITKKSTYGSGESLIASIEFNGNGIKGTVGLLGTLGTLSLD